MPHCSAAGLGFIIIPAGFNALLEFLTGFTLMLEKLLRVDGLEEFFRVKTWV
jgi:hypothetical protein